MTAGLAAAIVVGVDPGARETGVAIVRGQELLGSVTVKRDPREPLLDVGPRYVNDVRAAIADALRTYGQRDALVAVEGVQRPEWRIKGKVKPIDPSAIMATAIVFGAVLGHTWRPAELVVIPPDRHGRSAFVYPESIAMREGGRGYDKRRHERSAYDVALAGPGYAAIARVQGRLYR